MNLFFNIPRVAASVRDEEKEPAQLTRKENMQPVVSDRNEQMRRICETLHSLMMTDYVFTSLVVK